PYARTSSSFLPYTTLFRSAMENHRLIAVTALAGRMDSNSLWIAAITTVVFTALALFMRGVSRSGAVAGAVICFALIASAGLGALDRKSTRLNSSHDQISYA